MQQELWLWARSQVLASLKAVCAMRAAASHSHPLPLPPPPPPPPPPPSEHDLRHASSSRDDTNQDHVPNSLRPSQFRGRTSNSTFHNSHGVPHGHNREDTDKPNAGEFPWIPHNPVKASRRHQELHRELLMAHKKGLAVCCRPELQMVMERRKREQTQKEEGEQCRSPLEQVLLKRQQKQEEVMKEQEEEEKVRHEIQLMEFVRVRSNLKKVHSALQKNTTS